MKTIISILFCSSLVFAANGTIVGSPTFAAAKFNTGLTAVSDSNYISLPTGTFSVITQSGSFGIDMWLKDATASVKLPFCVGTFGDTNVLFVNSTDTGTVTASVDAQTIGVGGTAVITGGAWHHVALTIISGTTARLFVDGVQQGTDTSLTLLNPPTDHTNGVIGNFVLAPGVAWPGSIDEFTIWSTAHYTTDFTPPTQPYQGNEAGLAHLYHLDSNAIDSLVPSVNIFPDDSNILYSGRWNISGSGASSVAITVNCGSYFDAVVTGTSAITLIFNNVGFLNDLDPIAYPQIAYSVDGGPTTRAALTSSDMTQSVSFPIAAQTTHRIRVFGAGVSDGANPSFDAWGLEGAVRFIGMATDDGTITLPIPNSKNTIEFLGDSIVDGVRVLNDCGGGSLDNATCMDGVNAFAAQTGRYLGLRSIAVGVGGSGLTTPGSGSAPVAIDSFPFSYSGAAWNPTNKPIATVIEYGTNDVSANSATWKAALVAYLAEVRAAYPSTFIFCIAVPSNPHFTDMGQVVAASSDPRLFYLNYHSLVLPTTDGTHPNTSGHNILAAQLSTDIQAQFNTSGVSFGVPGARPFIVIN